MFLNYILVLLFLVSLGLSISSFVISNKHLNAKRGPQGPQGPQGSQGEPGVNGKCPTTCTNNKWIYMQYSGHGLEGYWTTDKTPLMFTPSRISNGFYNVSINIETNIDGTIIFNGYSDNDDRNINISKGVNNLFIPNVEPDESVKQIHFRFLPNVDDTSTQYVINNNLSASYQKNN